MTRASQQPTNTTALPRPSGLCIGDREADVALQEVLLPADWWHAELQELKLAGGPLRVHPGKFGPTVLERHDVWTLAADIETSDDAVLTLLWHALAWGAGRTLRMCHQRLLAVASDRARAVDLLRTAAVLSRTEPEEAYRTLHPSGRGALRCLGPAFGTKFLYFAGGGSPQHPSLILDSLVATTLHREGWTSLRNGGGWPPGTYGNYCVLARRWADELAAATGSAVAADQVEKWLFDQARAARAASRTGP